MSVIKIESIYKEKRTSKAGKSYGVVVVTGTKYGTGDSWEQPIFDNNKKVLSQLEEFGIGDVANFKYEKNKNFFDLVSIEVPTKELIKSIDEGDFKTKSKAGGGGKKSSNASTNDSNMSKAEWAEKDRLTNIRIAKAVALKAAIDNSKIGTKVDELLDVATTLIPWLLDTDIKPVVDTGDDGLEPPTE